MTTGALGILYCGLVVVGLYAIGWATATVLQRLERPVSSAKRIGDSVSVLSTFTVGHLFGPGELLRRGLPVSGLPVSIIVNATVVATLAILGVVAFRRGFRTQSIVPGERARPPWSYRLIVVAMVLVLATVFEILLFGVVPVSPLLVLALGVAFLTAQRLLLHLFSPRSNAHIRQATDTEYERVATCYERFGRSPPTVIVSSEEIAFDGVLVYGVGPYTWVMVGEEMLSELPDEELAVAVTQADQIHRNGVPLMLGIMVPIMLGTMVAILVHTANNLTDIVALYTGIGAVAPVVIGLAGLAWVGRRRVLAADAFTQTTFGADSVRGTYEQLGDDLTPIAIASLNRIQRLLMPFPTMAERLEHLGAKPSAD